MALAFDSLLPELRSIVGATHCISRAEDLLVYECDAYTLEKNLPNAVVLPRTTEQVVAIVKLCARLNLPFIPRGAGTSLIGAVLPVSGGAMITLSRMSKMLSVVLHNRRPLL